MMEGNLIAQCAESKVYQGFFYGYPAILKHRFQKEYRIPVLDSQLRAKRTIREARALIRCHRYGIPAPLVYFVDKSKCSIIMEYIPGQTVCEVLKELTSVACSSSRTSDVNRLCEVVLEHIGELAGLLHNSGFIHGDLTTSNIICVELPNISTGESFSLPRKLWLEWCRDSSELGLSDEKVGESKNSDEFYSIRRVLKFNCQDGITSQDDDSLPIFPVPFPLHYKGLTLIDFGLIAEKCSLEEKAVDLYLLERCVAATHPSIHESSEAILRGYCRTADPERIKEILERLGVVRSRGRKRSMVG